MRKECKMEAPTVEEAVALAAAELGVPAEELEVEVLQQPQKKAFGLFGGATAIISASYEEQEPETPAEKPAKSRKPRGEKRERKEIDREPLEDIANLTPTADEDLTTAAKEAKAYLMQLLEALGAGDTALTVYEHENGCRIFLEGEQEGLIIGRRGDTLDALQYLTSLVANRTQKEYYRVSLNVGNYREKREKSLTGLARKHASNAARTGRRITLEPMNPYERRIIHTAVQDIDGATSWSEGRDPNRHVIIGPSEDNRNAGRGRRGGNRGGNRNNRGNRGGNGGSRAQNQPINKDDIYMRYSGSIAADRPLREFVSRSNPLPTADGSTPPEKTISAAEETGDFKLYGRIDL